MTRSPAIPFLVLGIALMAIGAAGQRALAGVGVPFLVLGIVLLTRQKRGSRQK